MDTKRLDANIDLYLASDEAHEILETPDLRHHVESESKLMDRSEHIVVRTNEIPELREKNKKRFKMSDGTEQDVFYATDVHAFDEESGEYLDIEDTITEDENGKCYVCGKHSFVAKFSNNEKNDELFSIEQGKYKVTVLAKKAFKNRNKGVRPDVSKRYFDSDDDSKIVRFDGVEENSVYEYTVEASGVKENIVVKNARSEYKYPFILKCTNVKATFDAENKTIVFIDIETEDKIFHIPAPFMVDSEKVTSTAVDYELIAKDNGDYILTITADTRWMNDESRAFPVVIDPQIRITNANLISTYGWSNGWKNEESKEHTVGVVAIAEGNSAPSEEIDYSCCSNNSMKEAFDLAYNKWTRGCIPNANDFVWYKFTANIPEAHNGNCIGNYTFFTSGSLDTMGYLYNESGTQIGYNDDSNGRNFAISATLTLGETYYLMVKAWSSNTGSYKVSCVATDRYCCGNLAPETPTYTYERHRMYLDFNPPTLSLGARIKKAELRVYRKRTSATSEDAQLGLYHINDALCNYYNYEPHIEGSLIDYDAMNASGSDLCYAFDVTNLIERLSKGETYNNKFVLKLIDETVNANSNVILYGASSTKKPELAITYEPNYAVNTSYQAHTHSLGKFGQAAIDIQYGNLMFDSTDFSWSGNRMPVTIKHLYNSILGSYRHTSTPEIELNVADFSAMNVGYGFKLNVMQSMCMVGSEYIFTDESGSETILTPSDGCIYKNEDGDMSYDSCSSILTIGDEKRTFDTAGRLITIEDGNHNTNKVNYTAGRITSVVDGAGRTFEFHYSGNNLVSIVAPDGTSVQYTYSDNNLATVTYPDGSKAVIEYMSNTPASVILKDASGNDIYKVAYSFSGYKVTSVTEFGVSEGAFVQGSQSTYSYSMASKRTTVTTAESDDGKVIKTVYTFDDDGNVVSDYVYSEETGNTGIDGDVSGIHPYSADGGASIIRNNTNLLYNHTFQNGLSNWNVADECCSCTTAAVIDCRNNSDRFRRYILKIEATDSTAANNTVSQNTVSLAAGEYTFSAYVRVNEKFQGENSGVFIRVCTLDGVVLAVSEKLVNTNSQYVRLVTPFELTSTQQVKVEFVLDGAGVIYVCAPQLENNPFANDYNMLQNGNFEMSDSYWTVRSTDCSISSDTRFNMNRAVKILGNVIGTKYFGQIVYPIYEKTVRETFTLSGWAKGYGLPMHKRNGSKVPTFRLRAVIRYSDNTIETHTADFSACTDEWQFTSLQFAKEQFKAVTSITIYCDYDYNFGEAYFDDIQLVRNSIETGVTSDDFTSDDTDETPVEEDTVESEDSGEPDGFEEHVDGFGNAITETTFTDGEFGTIYRSFGFTEDGNDLVTEIDARGNKTTYEVDSRTSRNKEVTDRCGNKTAYEYDDAGRTVKVISKNASGAEIAHVGYAYDGFDNMTEIARGDGMKYALKYNAFHTLESVGIDGKDEPLAKYTYSNGNGRLKEMAYANGDRMTATYNGVGQLVSEKWFDKNNALIAHYKYVYDNSGNIVRSIDITGAKEYTYVYTEGTLNEAKAYAIKLDEERIVCKTLLNNTRYIYDNDGNITKKLITFATDDTSFIYHYDNSDNNTVVRFNVGDDKVSSHSKSDSFGRKIFDELQLGAGFISRQFEYVPGKATEVHTTEKLLKSSPTTQLVSRILLSDGRTIEYEYDAEERITKVTDSVDGTTEYTYDALGQLLTERLNGHIVNSMTYDTYGNISSKSGKTYFYDPVWKDLLVKVDSEEIVYDAQGNPTKYLGHDLTWEKGRQLKSFDKNTYTYNANGIRTSKTINGVKHEYTLDGTKILKETWDGNTLTPLYDNEESVCGIIYNGFAYYFMKNLQGDIIAITDTKGKVVASYTYDAWGVCTIISDTTGNIARINPFRYRGYYYDEEIGLYYLQSRYYDPEIDRFLNVDALEMDTSLLRLSNNLFVYCDNSPISFYDLYGYKKTSMSVKQTKIFGIMGFVVNLVKYGSNIFKIFKTTNAKTIEKTIISIMFLLPVNVAAELTYYYVKHFASLVVTLGTFIIMELASIGLNAAKASAMGLAITVACTIASVYLPKLYDSVKMIIYGIKNKNYYWDRKWYGIKYYANK